MTTHRHTNRPADGAGRRAPHRALYGMTRRARGTGRLPDWRWLLLLGGIGALMMGAALGATGSGSPDAVPGIAAVAHVALDLAVDTLPVDGQDAYLLVLGVMSKGADPAVITFRTGQLYDFVVLHQGREVWRWSHGRVFHEAVHQQVFRPGELTVFTAVWDGRDLAGEPVAGPVEVRALLTGDPPLATRTVRLERG